MSDSENEVDNKEQQFLDSLPRFRIRVNEMPLRMIQHVALYSKQALEKHTLDKDAAVEIVRLCQANPDFCKGEGEWQCIVGRNFGASLTFDANGISILCFKSG